MIDRRMRPPFDPAVEPALAQLEAEFHGFEGFAPDATVTAALLHARDNWMTRMLA